MTLLVMEVEGAAAAAVVVVVAAAAAAGDETHTMIAAMIDMTAMTSMTTDTGNRNIHTAVTKSNLFLMTLQVQ